MIQIVKCKNCSGTSIPIGSISVNVVLTKGSYCEHCHESKHKSQNYFFCSVKCFYEFVDNTYKCISWKE